MADRTPCRGGQGQMLDGPTLGVRLAPDPDQAMSQAGVIWASVGEVWFETNSNSV